MPVIVIFAQQAGLTSEDRSDVLFWCTVLLGVAVLLGLVAWWIRRRFARPDEPDAGSVSGMGFSLADLRQMRDDGQLSPEEYDYARRKLIAKTRQSLEEATEDEPLPNARAEPLGPADPVEPGDDAELDPDDSGDFPTRGTPTDLADNPPGPDKTDDANADDPPPPRPT